VATSTTEVPLVHSYLFLRRAIGIIGLALPVVLIVGNLIWPHGVLLDSISAAYYSPLRGVLIGSLSAVGVFLVAYRGYGRIDDVTGDIAGTAAIGAALFPTSPLVGASAAQNAVDVLHNAFAGVFFLALVVFCLFLFPRDVGAPTPAKRERDAVYRATGVTIFVAIVLLGITTFTSVGAGLHPKLWLETIAILAFGVAWAVKGEALGVLRDRVDEMRSANGGTQQSAAVG
jgi:hypothetical protein